MLNFFKPKEHRETAAPPSSPQQFLHQAFTSLGSQFSSFIDNLQSNPPVKSSFNAIISNANDAVRIKSTPTASSNFTPKNFSMSAEVIEERLDGVPVYALSNDSHEFVLVSGTNTGKKLGLFCFSEADADTLLKQMKSVDPPMSSGSQVVAVPLSKIFQLQVDGVGLRLLPEASQVKNALKERKMVGSADESFPGVPVFQLKSLILRNQDKRYRPLFFRKEDLEKSLSRASSDQKQSNPILRPGDIQVAALEDIIRDMKDNSVSSWEDAVFFPPGFDVSTN